MAVVAGGCALANLVIGARHFLQVPRLSDFMLFYAAATVARQHGWSHLYDLKLQAATEAALDPQGYFLPFYYPPPVAVLALPFSYLPLIAGYIAWVLLLLVVLVITWWLAAPGVGAAKLLQIVLAVGLFPLAFGIREGQLVLVVGLGLAIAWRTERAGYPVWAGAALSLLALKPQLAFLVPVALLVAGRYRVLAGLAIAGGLLAAASFLMIGGEGVRGWMAAIEAASRVHQEAYSLRGWLGTSAWVLPLQAATAALALVAAWRHRHSFALVLGAAVVGSCWPLRTCTSRISPCWCPSPGWPGVPGRRAACGGSPLRVGSSSTWRSCPGSWPSSWRRPGSAGWRLGPVLAVDATQGGVEAGVVGLLQRGRIELRCLLAIGGEVDQAGDDHARV
ncbi:MAG TPA: glycosyltransferase family 87 protein [Candidatus Dormibacteraeota bacterium]